MEITCITADCIQHMDAMEKKSVDVVVTSPPYNLDINYNSYDDKKTSVDYLQWTEIWTSKVFQILKPSGSFFINIDGSSVDPWIPFDVANVIRKQFQLQNHIIWAKSVSIGETSHGHFKPINSKRFLNKLHENIFHFTKTGNVVVDRLAVGVPFMDQSNVKRWGHKENLRCRGNIWHLPYKTIVNKSEKGHHPAIFPVELPEMCLKLHGITNTTLVVDPFGGTGTTAVACKKNGVSCVSIDIDQTYTNISQERVNHVECTEIPS